MGNPFKRKKFQRVRARTKKAFRSSAVVAVKVHKVLDPIVTTGLGIVFGAPGAVVGTGLSWVGMRAVAPMAARNQGLTGNNARSWARGKANRNATYAAIGGSLGATASVLAGGGWLGLGGDAIQASSASAKAASASGGVAAAGSPQAAQISANQAATSLAAPKVGGIVPGAMPAAAGSPQAAAIAAAQASSSLKMPLASVAGSSGVWGTLGKVGETALGLAPSAAQTVFDMFKKTQAPAPDQAPPPGGGGSGGGDGSDNGTTGSGGGIDPALIKAAIIGGVLLIGYHFVKGMGRKSA